MSTHRIAILTALEAHGGRYSYGQLRKELGIHKASFCDVIKKMHKAELIHSEGAHRKRILVLGAPQTPLAEPSARDWSHQKKPQGPATTPKERRCLRCRERFMSTGPENHICRTCKMSKADAVDLPIQSLPYGYGRER